jgi:hypothetical protein
LQGETAVPTSGKPSLGILPFVTDPTCPLVPKVWANTKVDNFMHLMYTRLACQAFSIAELLTCMPNSFIHNLLATSQQTRKLEVYMKAFHFSGLRWCQLPNCEVFLN